MILLCCVPLGEAGLLNHTAPQAVPSIGGMRYRDLLPLPVGALVVEAAGCTDVHGWLPYLVEDVNEMGARDVRRQDWDRLWLRATPYDISVNLPMASLHVRRM